MSDTQQRPTVRLPRPAFVQLVDRANEVFGWSLPTTGETDIKLVLGAVVHDLVPDLIVALREAGWTVEPPKPPEIRP